jgi:hypothetical protein
MAHFFLKIKFGTETTLSKELQYGMDKMFFELSALEAVLPFKPIFHVFKKNLNVRVTTPPELQLRELALAGRKPEIKNLDSSRSSRLFLHAGSRSKWLQVERLHSRAGNNDNYCNDTR